MDLKSYDIILINTSAGKDSLAMSDHVVEMAKEQDVADRVTAVHCDLGRVEWAGTKELAHRQCLRYGLTLHVVDRPQGDLLQHVAARGKWMGPGQARYCTSDHKRDRVNVLITALVGAWNAEHQSHLRVKARRAVRVLNCMGMRAQESPDRAKLPVLERNERTSSSVRVVDNWLPIHDWTEAQVWDLIRSKGLEYHKAYDLGMPRLSCVFCFYAPADALKLAGYHNPELLQEYVDVERRIQHDFKHKQPIVQIQQALDAGWVPQGKVDGALWSQCA